MSTANDPNDDPTNPQYALPELGYDTEADKDTNWAEKKRKCHDIVMILIFFVFWMGMFVIAGVAFNKGDPARLTNGVDYQGVTCGTEGQKDKSNIVYPRTSTDLARQGGRKITKIGDMNFYGICVKECPKAGTFVCRYDFNGTKATFDNVDGNPISNDGPCWYVGLDTDELFNYCTPKQDFTKVERKYCVIPGTSNKEFYNFKKSASNSTFVYVANDPRAKGETYYDGPNKDGVYFPNENCMLVAVDRETLTIKTGGDDPLSDQAAGFRRTVARWAGDVKTTAPYVFLFGFVVTFVFGFVLLWLLSRFVKCIVWFVLDAVLVLLVLMSFFLAYKGGMLGNSHLTRLAEQVAMQVESTGLASAELIHDKDLQQSYEYGAWFMIVVTLITLTLICFYRKKVNIACGVMQEASLGIQKLPVLVIFPFFPYLLQCGLFAYTAWIAMYIASSGNIDSDDIAETVNGKIAVVGIEVNATVFKAYTPTNTAQVLGAIHFFGYLWTDQVIKAISMVTIAGAVSQYYFARDKTANPRLSGMGAKAVKKALWRCLRYSFGSVVLGGLVIAVIRFLRWCMLYLQRQTKDLQKHDVVLRMFVKCMTCCLWCLEKCLQYITKSAYILIAIKGESFCAATKDAFTLLFANIGTIGITQSICSFLMILSDLLLVMASSILFWLFIDNRETYKVHGDTPLSNEFVPVLVVFVLSAFVAHTFMGVYGMAVDTVLLCFCIDKSENANNPNGYFMSDSLCKALGVKKSDLNNSGKGKDKAPTE